ncbi:MAG TPA: cytochrome P450 [Acidimicrobiales bacterium]|jgi:cytochrome P450|nr:cytochrome P450 [Acidimicrobiales bacterium]
MDELYWDPFDIDLDTDPHPTWKRMRDHAPVYRNDRHDFYALSRHADVETAHRDVRGFSSAHGTVLELMGPDEIGSKQMIFLDPPEHDRLRALVSRAFTPRRVNALEGEIRAICAELLDAQSGSDCFDYLADFGTIVPSKVISALLGVPEEERESVREQIDLVFHIEPGVGMINDVSFGAQIWLHTYLSGLLEERRQSPRDDMLTALVEAEITDDGREVRRLTHQEATEFANLLLSAGTETTARLLGWAAVLLAEHPDQRAALAVDWSLIPNAIEELLRFEAPSPVQGRFTTREVELHGTTIPAGSRVLLLTGSAGRDERKYEDPDRFDIRRRFDSHVSFGHGIHFCVGAALARLEGRVALEETLRRYPRWDVDHGRAERLHTSTVRGYARVPVSV